MALSSHTITFHSIIHRPLHICPLAISCTLRIMGRAVVCNIHYFVSGVNCVVTSSNRSWVSSVVKIRSMHGILAAMHAWDCNITKGKTRWSTIPPSKLAQEARMLNIFHRSELPMGRILCALHFSFQDNTPWNLGCTSLSFLVFLEYCWVQTTVLVCFWAMDGASSHT